MEPSHIDALPNGLDVQSILPHHRDVWARDETCFNQSKTKFVAAFNIYEHSMMNEMGRIVWGVLKGDTAEVQDGLNQFPICCWERPFAHWIDDNCFAVKFAGGKHHYPIVAIHFEKGFQIVGGYDKLQSRAHQVKKENLSDCWLSCEQELLR